MNSQNALPNNESSGFNLVHFIGSGETAEPRSILSGQYFSQINHAGRNSEVLEHALIAQLTPWMHTKLLSHD
jgi:hypothetical protein